MKRTTLVAVTAAALVLLAGCSSTTEEGVSLRSEPVGSPAATSAKPLAAETPAPEPSEARDEAAFVQDVRESLRPENVIPSATDSQLIDAGMEACAQSEAGTAPEDISVIDGEERAVSGYYLDSYRIYSSAADNLC